MRDIFYNPTLKDWIEKLLVVLLADYLLLFGMESISPGIVMGVFNMNYLLLIILALLLYLGATPSKEEQRILSRFSTIVLSAAGIFLVIITIFSLYKALSWQIALYTLLSLVTAGMLYKVLSR